MKKFSTQNLFKKNTATSSDSLPLSVKNNSSVTLNSINDKGESNLSVFICKDVLGEGVDGWFTVGVAGKVITLRDLNNVDIVVERALQAGGGGYKNEKPEFVFRFVSGETFINLFPNHKWKGYELAGGNVNELLNHEGVESDIHNSTIYKADGFNDGNVDSGGGEDVSEQHLPVVCENLTVSYDNGKVVAVNKLNMKVESGVVLGILGGNGAGKTSTLRTFGGIIPPSSGILKVGGNNMATKAGAEGARRVLGYCPDTGGLIRQATIREHIGVALSLRGMENRWPEALDLVEKFGLLKVLDRQTGGFSHGMSRRLSVLLAVLTSSSVLILDEPFDGVDPLGVEATEDSIKVAAKAGLTVIVSTHLISLLSKVSERISVMSEGRIVAEEPAEVFRSEDGEKYYETLLRNTLKQNVQVGSYMANERDNEENSQNNAPENEKK